MVKSNRNIIWIIILSLLTGTISCNKFDELKSPVDGFKVILNYDIFSTFLTFRFIDAPSGELIGASNDEKVDVYISGTGAGAVVDQIGNHDTIFSAVHGIVSLALNPKDPWVPSTNNILSIMLKTENEQYKTSSVSINIDSLGSYSYNIYLEPNNVDKLGLKENTYYLGLNSQNELLENFIYSSSGNELSFIIPAGSKFEDENGKPVSGEKIKLNIRYFLQNGKAAVPSGLINNIRSENGEIIKKATDFYQLAEINIFDEKGNRIKISNPNINIKLQIRGNYYNPLTKQKLQVNDSISFLNYNLQNKIWEVQENTVLLADTIGFYGIMKFNNSQFYAFANSVNTCQLGSQFQFNFTNKFKQLPVGVRVNLYRKYDSRYIGNKVLQVSRDEEILNADFVSIENEPIKFYVLNQSDNNPFNAAEPNYYTNASCGKIAEPFIADITSKRVELNGQLFITSINNLPEQGLELYVDFYRVSNNSMVFRKPITIKSTESEFQISTGLIENQDLYIKLVSANNFMAISNLPERIPFNSSTGPFNWEFDFTSEDISNEFVFNFDISESFGNRELMIKAEFKNLKSGEIDNTFTLKTTKENNSITKKLVLDNTAKYSIKLKRFEDQEQFLAYPYKMEIKPSKGKTFTFNTELLPVVKKEVTAKIGLICGSSVVYPTINGIYHSVLDDKWQEFETKDGNFSQILEIGGTYEIGTIFENELFSSVYKIESTIIELEIEMNGGFCDSMGW